ncbi:MAG: deoxynucleoside kinase [Candidatus Tectomicrobia bacterium]|nr:deoxynucleoside kinase [Candidatus Tectomicrobia bacterium]
MTIPRAVRTPPRYIAVEGPIGVGKTSLVRLLADRLDGRVVLEASEENPFLEKFYAEARHHAFQTQIFFLLSRYRQQLELSQAPLFERTTVTDYLFVKDRIFAYLNLDEDELQLYEQLYPLLKARIPTPDLVIFLQASTEVLMRRIAKRQRALEKSITGRYVDQVNQAYNEFFFTYDEAPLLVVNTNEVDFIAHEEDLDDLITKITSLKQGREYYVPLGSV